MKQNKWIGLLAYVMGMVNQELPLQNEYLATAEWTVQQLREAFPWETAPRYLLRDRDRILGADFVEQVKAMGIKQVLSAPRSPWQ